MCGRKAKVLKLGDYGLFGLLPGVALVAVAVLLCMWISSLVGLPVMLLAMVGGLVSGTFSRSIMLRPGLDATAKPLLRLGVSLLGAQISLVSIAALGPVTLALVVVCLLSTISIGYAIGRLLGLDSGFALMVGGATAICGASAALALSSIIPESPKKSMWTGFTIIIVTTFSTAAMLLYPLVLGLLAFSNLQSGFVIGASIHDVAQVVGAGYAISKEAGDTAIVVKLARVLMLVPVLFVVARIKTGGTTAGPNYKIPGFMIGFLTMVGLNSIGLIPEHVGSAIRNISQFALIGSVFAIGVVTPFAGIRAAGRTAVIVALLATTILFGFSVLGAMFLSND
jgi:uncharacterized integral membrane protein (TIGR00698 family)